MTPQCNLCGSSSWIDFANRKGVRCSICGSLERTRLQFLHMQRLDVLRSGAKVLHVAPELGLSRVFNAIEEVDYQPVDAFPEQYKSIKPKKFDLCKDAPELPPNYYDVIVHNHVLEHILCDVTSVMLYLQKSLAPHGYHFFSVPFHPSRSYEEYLGPLTPEVATRRFGQKDHCRWFSIDDFDKTFGMFLNINISSFRPLSCFSSNQLRGINFPSKLWDVVDGSTTIVLKKSDSNFGLP